MTSTSQIETIEIGSIIRFVPSGGHRHMTVKVIGGFDGLSVFGRRASVNTDGTVSTRGETHCYFIRPGATVEVVR